MEVGSKLKNLTDCYITELYRECILNYFFYIIMLRGARSLPATAVTKSPRRSLLCSFRAKKGDSFKMAKLCNSKDFCGKFY